MEDITDKHLKKKLSSVRQRCTNSNDIRYKYYGGKGIKCFLTLEDLKNLWIRDNASLMEWATIDRINSKGNYEFSNCRFLEHRINASHPKTKEQKIETKLLRKKFKAENGICPKCQNKKIDGMSLCETHLLVYRKRYREAYRSKMGGKVRPYKSLKSDWKNNG